MHSTPSFSCQLSPKRKASPRAHRRKFVSSQAKLVLAHTDTAVCRKAAHHFRQAGIELATAGSAGEVHRLIHRLGPQVVFLDVNLADESGYLTCAKIKLQQQACTVILLGNANSAEAQRLAAFAGADALVDRSQSCRELIEHIAHLAVNAKSD